MAGTVLYEVSYHFNWHLLSPLFLWIASFLVPKIVRESGKRSGSRVNLAFMKVFLRFFRVFTIFMLCVMIVAEIISYREIVGAYQNGNYSTVEGLGEHYSPMPYSGHSNESFTIDGVMFSYSDFLITQGYHNAASHGGVITHNGQHLKIRYVTGHAPTKNVIVYIEELPEP